MMQQERGLAEEPDVLPEEEQMRECEECEGTGWVWDGWWETICPICGGTGRHD